MGDPDSSSTETDAEEWSEDTFPSSPQHAGYLPLDHYEALQDDEQPQQQQQQQRQQQAGDDSAEGALSDGGGNSQQPDIASAMLRAMEADYRACVESESKERPASNGPIAPSSTSVSDAEAPGQEETQVEDIGDLSREQDEALPSGQEEGAESAGQVSPPRPISPLGQDQAERVMRAMQGFALAAPALPPAHFEVDWESPGVLANLTTPSAAAASPATTAVPAAPARRIGVEEEEGEGVR